MLVSGTDATSENKFPETFGVESSDCVVKAFGAVCTARVCSALPASAWLSDKHHELNDFSADPKPTCHKAAPADRFQSVDKVTE